MAAAWTGSAAAATTVRGTLVGGKGARVMALAGDGSSVTSRVGAGGRFALRLSPSQARSARLQIVTAKGAYGGPVVLRRAGTKGFVALGGSSVDLGRVLVRGGYAQLARPLRPVATDPRGMVTVDAKGRPVGAGRLGLVRTGSARVTSLSPAASILAAGGQGGQGGGPEQPRGSDTDRDGVPNAFDADDDGDLVIDAVDPDSAASNRGLFSTLFLRAHEALNVNAGGVTPAAIDAVVSGENRFTLNFFFDDGYAQGRTVTGGHVDCGALVYCARGTGTAMLAGGFMNPDGTPAMPGGIRWADLNLDGSGYPNLAAVRSSDGRASWAAGVQPRVGTTDLRPGDTYTVVLNTGGGPVELPTALSPYFVTTPALVSVTDAGVTTPMSYPLTDQSPGSSSNPVRLSSGSIGIRFWRPQRRAIPGAEAGDFVDMGRLHYGVVLTSENGSREFGCAGLYRDLSPTLVPATGGSDPFAVALTPLVDTRGDAPPSPADQLGLTVDIAGCLAANGAAAAGQAVDVTLTAAAEPRPGGMDRAALTFRVQLP
jgi:hypothetical protein